MFEVRRSFVIALAVLWTAGCSALVSTDESELDGESDAGTDVDSGGGMTDGGDDEDAFVPPTDGGGEDAGVVCEGGCDDGVACTEDSCVDTDECEHDPDDSACDSGERCNPASGCVPIECTGDSDCDDGLVCNGEETCDPEAEGADETTGCLDGTPPSCDDGYACTFDECDDSEGGCVNTPDHDECDDGIDCSVDTCDTGAATDSSGCINVEDDSVCDTGFCFTGATCSISGGGCVGGTERDCVDGDPCTMDSCDDTGMMCVNAPRDDDGDGYPAEEVFGDTCSGGTDCDDTDDTVNPGATEYCNGRDDDCDGDTDEGCTEIPDSCADAEEIELDATGAGSVSSTFNIFTPDYRAACGESGGNDAIYYIDIDGLSDVRIDTIGSTADTVLAVGLECSNTGFRMGCDDDIDAGLNLQSRIWVHRIRPRFGDASVRLYILVDAFNSTVTGDFTVNVQVSTARADSCATPIDITGGGSLVGSIGAATGIGGERGSCQGVADTSAEAIARFEGPSDGDFRFDVFSNDFDPDLYVRNAPCNSGSEVDCEAGDGATGGFTTYWTRIEGSSTPGSTYYLFIDGAGAGDDYFASFEP